MDLTCCELHIYEIYEILKFDLFSESDITTHSSIQRLVFSIVQYNFYSCIIASVIKTKLYYEN